MKRISTARLKSLEADGAKVHRMPQAPAGESNDLMLDMVRQNALAMQEFARAVSGVTEALSSFPREPETVTKTETREVPVEVPVRIDYEFKVNRNKDGLISTVDLMDGDRVAGVATFKRNKDYQVTSINTRKV